MSEYPATELTSATCHGSGSGTKYYYKVEVRTSCSSPLPVGTFVIDHCWRALPIQESKSPWGINVPVPTWHRDGLSHGLVPFVVAEAHRWAFLAYLEAASIGGALCIQTRLVEIAYRHSYSTEEIGVSPPQTHRGPHDLPAPFTPRIPTDGAGTSEPRP